MPNVFSRFTNRVPGEVIQAACDIHGLSRQDVHSVHTRRLNALANNIWIVHLNERIRAIVTYTPGTQPIAAPWFE